MEHKLNTNEHVCLKLSSEHSKESGLVLFIALIALVVMSLAAVALIRSVDTNTIISENLSFKQVASTAGDTGIESAISWLAANQSNLTNNNNTSGYYAICSRFDSPGQKICGAGLITAANTWNPGVTSAYATGPGIVSGKDANSNTIEYIVERMCTATGDPTTTACQYGTAVEPTGGSGCMVDNCNKDSTTPSPAYRITARVTGPKNTVSFIQAFIF